MVNGTTPSCLAPLQMITLFPDGSLAVIDCSLEAQQGDIVVAEVEGEFTMKRFVRVNGAVHLEPANPKYSPIIVTPDTDARIFGVVTSVLHLLKRRRK
jgi:DNA polymerase V